MQELLPSPIFNQIREKRPDFVKWASEKIRCIPGDTTVRHRWDILPSLT